MSPPKQSRQSLANELEELLQQCVDSGAPGVSAAIASSGEIVWESAKGHSDIVKALVEFPLIEDKMEMFNSIIRQKSSSR